MIIFFNMELRRVIRECKDDLKKLLADLGLTNEKLDVNDNDYLGELAIRIDDRIRKKLKSDNITLELSNILKHIGVEYSHDLDELIAQVVENKDRILDEVG